MAEFVHWNNPRFSTPRRTLFTSNIIGKAGSRHNIATPLLPDLFSPVSFGINDIMDSSPLSHKGLYSTEITPFKPGKLPEDDDYEMMLESPVINHRKSRHIYSKRNRLVLRSRSSIYTEGYSGNSSAKRQDLNTESVAFRFSSEANLPLAECVQESPLQKRLVLARRESRFAGLSGTGNYRNSSSSSRTKLHPNLVQQPRRPYRRCLGLLENSVNVAAPLTNSPIPQRTVQSTMSSEDVQGPVLPHFHSGIESEAIPRITQETFLDVLDGKFDDQYIRRIVLDCRFDYEYEGGHIDGAIHCNDKDILMRHLTSEAPMEGKVLLILHCEYSAYRAPLMARYIRSEDRAINAEFYPRLSYPEVYILDGGYSEFFTQHRHRCCPQSYVEMNDKEHIVTCEREMGKLQRYRKGLGRAKTFAFGPNKPLFETSPTALGQNSLRHGKSLEPSVGRSFNRRAASY